MLEVSISSIYYSQRISTISTVQKYPTLRSRTFLFLIELRSYILLRAAIVSGGKGTAQGKIDTLREAGVTVVESPAKIGAAMLDVFKQRGLVSS